MKSREQEKKELLKGFGFNRTKEQPDPYEMWAANISACIEYSNQWWRKNYKEVIHNDNT